MFPIKRTGQTIKAAAGTNVAATTNGASLVLVTNINATAAVGYFRACDTGAEAASATDIPVPASGQIMVAVPPNAGFWAAFGADLAITPVENANVS